MIWWFVFAGNVQVADWFYSDGFSVESNFERNVIPLSEMTIEIDPEFDATFINRTNYYNGLLIGVFDGEIYSHLGHGQVRLICSDNLETYQVIYPPTGTGRPMRLTQIHIANSALYYTRQRGNFEKYDFEQTTHNTIIEHDVGSFVKFDDFMFHRLHAWNFYRHVPFPRVDGNIYRFDFESGESEVWIEDRVREFFADIDNDRILFSVRSNILEVDFAGENRRLITGDFLHYGRLNPYMERGWTYDGNSIFWIHSGDWTLIESSIFSLNLETNEQEYLGRISSASGINIINDYVIVSTQYGSLYLIDIDAKHRRLLSDDVFTFAVVGDHIFYRQIGTGSIYVMDLNGNVSLFSTEAE